MQCLSLAILLSSAVFATQSHAQSREETAFAQSILQQLQWESFATKREYCGTIGITDDGQFVMSRVRKGRRDGCRPPNVRNAEPVASFHTHAAFDYDADSEVPSPQDVYIDSEEGLNGYVSTPGGRFWFVDGKNRTVSLICGVGCLPSDPAFEPGVWGQIRGFYTIEDLEWRLEGF